MKQVSSYEEAIREASRPWISDEAKANLIAVGIVIGWAAACLGLYSLVAP